VTSQWFSAGTPVSSTNKTDRHDITEILLKVPLSTINQPTNQSHQILSFGCHDIAKKKLPTTSIHSIFLNHKGN
jgi:hypothetical protein